MSSMKTKVVGHSAVGAGVNVEEVKRALSIFATHGQGIDITLRNPYWEHNASGNANDHAHLLRMISERNHGNGAYWTFNPFPLGLEKERVPPNGPLIEHITARHWVYIDVDRDKTYFEDDPATNEEKLHALEVSSQVRQFLAQHGFPLPVVTDSGNGYGLFYRCDLPNDKDTRSVFTSLLHGLAGKFGEKKMVDKAVHSANRLTRIPGTMNRRGVASNLRPYRPCLLYSVPNQIEKVSLEAIKAVADELSRPIAETVASPPRTGSSMTVTATTAPDDDEKRKAAYGKRALEIEAGKVAMASSGDRNNQLFRSGAALFQLVAGGVLSESIVDTTLREMAQRAGLERDPNCGPVGIAATIESAKKAGSQAPRSMPVSAERNGTHTPSSAKAKESSGDDPPSSVSLNGEILYKAKIGDLASFDAEQVRKRSSNIALYTMDELMKLNLPEPVWVVKGILSEGLNILAGKPKQGKSMLALNLALTIAAGGKALGDVQTEPGDVLYLSLEDKFRRVQARARRMLTGMPLEVNRRLTIATVCPRQGRGGLRLIDAWMQKAERPTLVIVDVWGRFKPQSQVRSQDSAYDVDYDQMTAFKTFLDDRTCNGLSLMHCRKAKAEDVLEEVSGTMGLSGAADGILVLSRARNSNEAEIFITGRDWQEAKLGLEFDQETFCWKSLGPADGLVKGKLQTAILDWLRKHSERAFFPKDIAIGIGESDSDSVRSACFKLFDKHILRRVGNKWEYPAETSQEESRRDEDYVEF